MLYEIEEEGMVSEDDLIAKIGRTVAKKDRIEEADVLSLMILVRKLLDKKPPSNPQSFLIVRLFANWAAHVEITQSNTGLRVLSAINDALVSLKSADTEIIRKKVSEEIGFTALRREMRQFLNEIGVEDTIVSDNNVWVVFITYLIEIIRDVPLAFPSLGSLDNTKRKIYDRISRNPIKPGAGVVAIKVSRVDYGALGAKDTGEIMCLIIGMEDTTRVVLPLLIDARV